MIISIVVPAFNEEKLITGSLRQIKTAGREFGDLGWDTELIVCDNNSTDRTADLARAEDARVVFEPVNQIARARNRGAQSARGDWLIFVDADSRPSRELFAEVAQCIRSGRWLAGGCTVQLDQYYFLANLVTHFWNTVSRLNKWVAGSFIFCERKAFEEVGGFDESLFASEELALSRSLKKLAKRTGQRLVILHKHPILTSARKMHLYSRRELVGFFTRATFAFDRTVRNRESCSPWYDGRR